MKILKYLTVFLILGLVACLQDSDKDGIVDDSDKEPHTPSVYINMVDANGKAHIPEVYMLMDNTGSMNGYKVGGSEFLDVVSSIAGSTNRGNVNQEIGKITYQNFGSETISQELNFKVFNTLLTSSTQKDTSKVSNIVEHFNKLTTMVSDTTIGVYVTDAVISLGDKTPQLASILQSQLEPYCARVLGKEANRAIVIKCKSKFQGNYACSAEAKKSFWLSDPARPFYIFLFGKHDLLEFFIEKTIKNNQPITNAVTDVAFINYQPVRPIEAAIDMSKTSQGSWVLSADKPNTIDLQDNNPVEIAVGINLSYLTDIYPNIVLIKDNFDVSNGEILEFNTRENFFKDNKSFDNPLPNATHILKLKYTNMQSGQLSNIYLKKNMWYKDYTTDSDLSEKALKGKGNTYKLDKIIGSIFASSQISKNNPNLHIATINFNKP